MSLQALGHSFVRRRYVSLKDGFAFQIFCHSFMRGRFLFTDLLSEFHYEKGTLYRIQVRVSENEGYALYSLIHIFIGVKVLLSTTRPHRRVVFYVELLSHIH